MSHRVGTLQVAVFEPVAVAFQSHGGNADRLGLAGAGWRARGGGVVGLGVEGDVGTLGAGLTSRVYLRVPGRQCPVPAAQQGGEDAKMRSSSEAAVPMPQLNAV